MCAHLILSWSLIFESELSFPFFLSELFPFSYHSYLVRKTQDLGRETRWGLPLRKTQDLGRETRWGLPHPFPPPVTLNGTSMVLSRPEVLGRLLVGDKTKLLDVG